MFGLMPAQSKPVHFQFLSRFVNLLILSIAIALIKQLPAHACKAGFCSGHVFSNKASSIQFVTKGSPLAWKARAKATAKYETVPLVADADVDWRKGPPRSYVRTQDRRILTLAIPAMLGALIDPVLSLVDTYWVSAHLPVVALASLGPALNVEDWLFEVAKTIQVPVRTLTSQAMTAGSRREVATTLSQAIQLGLRFSVAVTVFCTLCAPALLWLGGIAFGSPMMTPATAYLVPRVWSMPALLVQIVIQAGLSGAFQDTRTVLRLLLLGSFVNAILTPIFVVGLHWGTAGAALATTIACYASAVAAWRAVKLRRLPGEEWLPSFPQLVARSVYGAQGQLSSTSESKQQFGMLIRANASLALRSFSSLSTWLVAGALVARKCDHATLAAHLCATKVFLFFLFTLWGFQLATQVLVSADVARGAVRHARWAAERAMRLACTVGVSTALMLTFFNKQIIGLISHDTSVITAFCKLSAPTSLMLTLYGVLWTTDGVLFGLGYYAWQAKCTTICALASVAAMMFARSAQEIWWGLSVMAVLRTAAVAHKAYFNKLSPLACEVSPERFAT
eukprot:TRINITY_DN41545_c0_g1_i1.p1 TRINITY_DN41545_c0_g1~~TRINITY_DN41545_c0_g1_i1.p1  ORF type:complete len:564 (+),score=59.38 TRINITY_DN41545_c0_g1_i1:99-1790(+)